MFDTRKSDGFTFFCEEPRNQVTVHIPTLATIFARHGNSAFWALAFTHSVISTIAPAIGFHTLPRDTVEGFLWGRSFQWGYFKHPPLQAWLLGWSEAVAPTAAWLAYLYAQICVLVTLFAIWRLARTILGPGAGVIASMLTLVGIHYYGPPMATFTPDTLSAPLWALTGLFWWRAVVQRRQLFWFALALTVAVSVYAKYVGLLLVGVLGVLTLITPEGRRELTRREPWLALVFGLALVVPHVAWIIDTGGSSLAHAVSTDAKADSFGMRLWFCFSFLVAQVIEHSGLIALVVLCIGIGRSRPRTELLIEERPVSERERTLLLAMAFAPILIALLTNLIVGGEFRQGRGTALFAFSGIAAVLLAGPVLRLGRLKVAAAIALTMVVALPIINAGHHHLRLAWGASVVPTLYPAQALADELEARWNDRTALPLRIVIGERWHAGNIAFYAKAKPQILLDGDFRISPWITRERLAQEGALVVWHPSDRTMLARLRELIPDLEADGYAYASPAMRGSEPTRLAYAVIEPKLVDPDQPAGLDY
ncbi:dolichyl-phosphate-mannose-protein mannosyltransferase [Phreatobacter oligotrophus]|uniref:Dolichyl-phosphate-mannose-protein mannosyltransferase n=1 Tax=Phreatobacter oligotrophus TaxID=1122261 RepID=A0A2T4YX25_9HYPH|nr:dolichyl-phosphate-mannose-protein mannosyltransferase [Phreatobacter oligotrophus]